MVQSPLYPPLMSISREIYDFLYHDLSLKSAGLFLGALLLVAHLFGLARAEALSDWLKKLPRHPNIGTWLLLAAFVWTFVIWSEMDLGEFFNLERPVQIILVAGFFAVSQYVKEFLAVRAIGFLMILAAAPVLDAAFLKPPVTRLLLVALAYAWILVGMFWVGMPYLMRDQIGWATAKPGRWKALCLLGAAYGAAILGCAVAFW